MSHVFLFGSNDEAIDNAIKINIRSVNVFAARLNGALIRSELLSLKYQHLKYTSISISHLASNVTYRQFGMILIKSNDLIDN